MKTSVALNPHIFRAYDIRGVAESDLGNEVATAIGRALGTMARRRGARTFAVGRDCRLTGPRLAEAITAGLRSTGLDVVDMGAVPTPLLYFSVHHRDLGGGVQVTGSHNPPEFNGFKMMIGRDTLHGEEIAELHEMIVAGDFEQGEGALSTDSIEDAYVDWVVDNIRMGERRLRVLVDGGNGIGGPVTMRLLKRLGVDVVGHCIEPDGTFPNHHPDPTIVETLDEMREVGARHGVDLSIGLDGDGDRIGVVDGNGEILWGDRLLILFSRAILQTHPGATIVSEVKCSQALFDDIARHGGKPIMWKAGHSLIKSKMKETGAALAGEMSGHIFFADRFFGFDDAVYSAARLVEILSRGPESLSERLADVPETFATPEIRVDCPEETKFLIAPRVAAHVGDRFPVTDIDGVRVNFGDGWGLVRASNTQPVLVLRAEATSPERRDEILAQLEEWVALFSRPDAP
ncbi:MAG: phosphomannomutase/phosphoglucomutase [Deltaproteobacteria bacterium]|nr:MAG: phosphomannomutase/phosphoglucomutase [Deltaproteobacteria bacterium]